MPKEKDELTNFRGLKDAVIACTIEGEGKELQDPLRMVYWVYQKTGDGLKYIGYIDPVSNQNSNKFRFKEDIENGSKK